jgi:hypothetical protein
MEKVRPKQLGEPFLGRLDQALDVFVSYSIDDRSFADEMVGVLERRGRRCWIADRDIPPGVLHGPNRS